MPADKKEELPPASPTWLPALALVAVAFAGAVFGLGGHEWFLRKELTIPEGQLQLAQQDFQTGNYQGAFVLFTKLANQGDPPAEYWLAHMTELGTGTKKDPAKAIALYKKAAAQGNVAAQAHLGEIYLDGDLTPPDFNAARTYLEQAALAGNARAAMLLGQIYRLGLGTPTDLTESFAWLEVASLEHNAVARRERDRVLKRLNPQQQDAAAARTKALMGTIKDETAPPAKAAPADTKAEPGNNASGAK